MQDDEIDLLRRQNAELRVQLAAEQARNDDLSAACQRLSFLVDSTDDIVWDWDIEHDCVSWSSHLDEALGYRPGQLEPTMRVVSDLIHPKDLERARARVIDHLKGHVDRLDVTCRFRSASGEWQWMRTRGQVMVRDANGRALRALGLQSDVSAEIKARDEAARQSELIERLFDIIPYPVYVKDREARYVGVNRACAKLMSRGGVDWYGKTAAQALPGPEGELAHRQDLDVLTSGEACRFEVSLKRQGGGIDLIVHKEALRDRKGDIIGVVSVAFDISDLRATERTLQEAAIDAARQYSFIEQLFDVIPMPLFTTDVKGRIRRVNRAMEDLVGLSREALQSFDGYAAYPDCFAELIGSMLADAENAERRARPFSRSFGQQGLMDGVLHIASVREPDGSFAGLVGAIVDNTEILRAQRDATQQGALLEQLLEIAPMMIYTKDRDLRFSRVNKAFEELFNIQRDEFLGKHVFELRPKEIAQVYDSQDRALLDQGGIQHYEADIFRKDGDPRNMVFRKTLFRDAQGEVAGLLGVGYDITEQRRNERSLIEARDAAQAANRAKSVFLANMSHEIRTPMNGILGMTELAMDAQLPEPVRELLGTVHSSARWLLQILNDILDLSRVEAGKLTLDHVPFDPQRELVDMLRMLQPIALQKKLRLSSKIDPALPPTLLGDPLRVRQVLTNLVGNAIKFTNQGTVSLTVERLPCPAIDAHPPMEGGLCSLAHLCIVVEDSGIGIPDDMLRRIWAPFEQADSSTTRRYGGTGLGLTISRRLIDLMGGEILVDSVVGQGSRFTVKLSLPVPVLESDVDEFDQAFDEGRVIGLPAPPRRLSILVAEDTPVNQTLIKALLTRQGHDVMVVDDGAQALQAWAAGNFDLILMDVQMPVMDGLEATRMIRAAAQAWAAGNFDLILMDVQMPVMDGLEATRMIRAAEVHRGGRIRIVAVTAHALPAERDRCLQAGMDEVLTKPIERAALSLCLSRQTVQLAVV